MLEIQLIRHATLIISLGNKKILVDPMLSRAGVMEPVAKVPNQNFNPIVELPIDIEKIIDCDAYLVTHTHRDHFDEEAAKLLPKNIPLFCQIEDTVKLQDYGFTNVKPVEGALQWEGITFNRTGGKHGHGLIAEKMAPVSGFVITCPMEPSVYIAGDTVWCKCVKKALEEFKPNAVVCNCGGAQFNIGRPITMTGKDLQKICSGYEEVKVIAVHMEAWNHCRLSRKELRDYVQSNKIEDRVIIPEDGERIVL